MRTPEQVQRTLDRIDQLTHALSGIHHIFNGNFLVQADCFTVMDRLATRNQRVDLIVTSPPYCLGKEYEEISDWGAFKHWFARWSCKAENVLADGGSLFLNFGSAPSNPTRPFEIATILQEFFTIQNVIAWVKSIVIDEGNAPGHYTPINSDRFLNSNFEYVFHCTHTGNVPLERKAPGVGVLYQDKTNASRWESGGSGLRCGGNVWFIPHLTIQSREKDRPHEATFPVDIVKKCIRLHGVDRIELMLDPFMGIGSSAIAAEEEKVLFIGVEKEPIYFMRAGDRVTAARVAAAAKVQRERVEPCGPKDRLRELLDL